MKQLLIIIIGLCSTLWAGAQTRTPFLSLDTEDYALQKGDAELPVLTQQFALPYGIPASAVRLRIEYPEWEALSRSEVQVLKQQHISLADTLAYSLTEGLSRGQSLIDVAVKPFMLKNGRPVRVTSLRLSLVYADGREIKHVPGMEISAKAVQKAAAAERYAAHSVLAQGRWVKISVQEEGFYALTPEFLAAQGFSNPSRVKIYGYGGRMLPEAFSLSGNQALYDDLNEQPFIRRADGTLVFFAEGTIRWTWNASLEKWTHEQNIYSTSSCYFLTEGDAPATIAQENVPSVASAPITSATLHALYQKQQFAWYGGGRDYYELDDFAATTNGRRQYTLHMPGLQQGQSHVVDWDFSVKNSMNTHVQLYAGDKLISTSTVAKVGDNETARGTRTTCNLSTGLSETQQFSITMPASVQGRLGYIRCNYKGALTPQSLSTQSFSPCRYGQVGVQISGATATQKLLHIAETAGAQHQWVSTSFSNGALTAQLNDGMGRYALYDEKVAYAAPDVVGEVPNQDLHAHDAVNYVIIIPASGLLYEEANRLGQAHQQKSGMTYRIVRADKIYNEFSSGTPDATAIRRYLKMLYERPSASGGEASELTHVLMFGDCAWDNRMITADWKDYNKDDFLLAYESGDELTRQAYSIGSLHSYVSDDYYALLDDGEGNSVPKNKIDLAVGRFLCHEAATAKTLVDKAIAYLNNERVGNWKNQVYMIADAGNENLHMTDAETISTQMKKTSNGILRVHKIYPDAYKVTASATGNSYPEASERIRRQMSRGALIFNYTGHGAPNQISHYNLLFQTDLSSNVSAALPLWVFASCEITPFDEQVLDMGRATLYNPNGGAVSVLCAARSVYASYNRFLDIHFMRHLLAPTPVSQRITMGEALRRAKNDLITPSAATDNLTLDATINKNKYNLLGDPALMLTHPIPGLVIDSINGTAFSATQKFQLRAGETVRFSGYVAQDDATQVDTDFNGVVTGTLFDREEFFVCKNFDNKNSDPMQFTDFTRVLYEGSANVEAGRFTITAAVPRTISYTTDLGRLSLYAVSHDHEKEYNGLFTQIYFNGTDESVVDTLGPKIFPYFYTPSFVDGASIPLTGTTLYAKVSDDTGLYATGSAMGHNIEMTLDDERTAPIKLDDYFTYDFGSYNSGLVSYPLGGLTPGQHHLQIRAWDVMGNSSTAHLNFRVNETDEIKAMDISATENPAHTQTRFVVSLPILGDRETEVRIEVYNTNGQRVWHTDAQVPPAHSAFATTWTLRTDAGAPLSRGIYLYRAIINGKKTDAKKLIVF